MIFIIIVAYRKCGLEVNRSVAKPGKGVSASSLSISARENVFVIALAHVHDE